MKSADVRLGRFYAHRESTGMIFKVRPTSLPAHGLVDVVGTVRFGRAYAGQARTRDLLAPWGEWQKAERERQRIEDEDRRSRAREYEEREREAERRRVANLALIRDTMRDTEFGEEHSCDYVDGGLLLSWPEVETLARYLAGS